MKEEFLKFVTREREKDEPFSYKRDQDRPDFFGY
jgi:hypothetical protein